PNKPYPFTKPNSPLQTVANIELITDGKLRLIARYHKEKLKLTLVDKSEVIRLKNKKTQSEITHTFKVLTCESDTPQRTLQCHIKGGIKANIAFLSPIENLHLKTFSLRSNLDLLLGRNTTISFLDTQIASERLVYSGHPEFLVSEASNAQLSIDNLLLNYNAMNGLTLTQTKPTEASFSASLYAEKIINSAPISEKKRQQIVAKNTPIPTQKYSGKLELSIAEFRLSKPIDQSLTLQSNYQTTINMKQNQQRLPPFSSQGNLSFNPEKLMITGDLTNYKMARLARFTVNSYLKRQKTQIELHRNEIAFSSTNSLKKHFFPHLPIDYDLHQGSVALQANILIDKGVTSGDISVFANSLSGYYKGFHFANVDSSTTILFSPQGIKSKFPISVHAELIHLGVLFNNVSMVFELDTEKEKYHLNRVFAEVFGGNISTHNVSSNSLTTIESIPIVIHNLHLEQALAHIEHEEIELTGILDGQIPLAIHEGLPVVTNGKLHSRYPGGVLRYLEGSRIDKNVEAAGENSILVVSKILKNYNYDALAIDIDYSKEGKLKASSRFKGRNPQFQNGRPVNLNLNIEDDIPALLKTMNAIDSSKLEGLFLKQLGIDE
ncbi:YdbH domain-containing protein, partial [Photobacterium profundum]